MGLDVTAYRKIELLDCVLNEDGEAIDPSTRKPLDWDTYFRAFVNPAFPGRADEIRDRACYRYTDSEDLAAGTYERYNLWREEIAKLAGYPLGRYERNGTTWESYCLPCWNGATGPFSELISFSDCEGVIGARVAKKLAADFHDFQEKADDHPDGDFRHKYGEWRLLFEMAADEGCVAFY